MGHYRQQEKYLQLGAARVCYIDEGSGPALLFVHGLGASMTNWSPSIEHFKHSYRVIALDLPGFGMSQRAGGECTVEQFSGAILALLSQLGVDRASIVGNSLGGLLALHISLEHPELVESLVLVDSAGAHPFPRWLRTATDRLPVSLLKRAVLFYAFKLPRYSWGHRLAGFYVRNEHTQAMLDEALSVEDRPDLDQYLDTYIRTTRTAISARLDDRIGEIDRPVLLVWGQKDLALPLKVGQRMNRMIKGSFLVAIPDAAHVPMLDQPEAFNAAVEVFLAGVLAGEGGL